jgi:hypothetical protein
VPSVELAFSFHLVLDGERHFTDYSLKSKSGFRLDQGLRMSRNIPDHYPSAAVKLIFVVGNLYPRLDCSHSVPVE